MKKTLFSIAFISILLLAFSCKNDPEKAIIGSWENTETQVTKIDSVAQNLYDANMTYLKQQKDMYSSQLDNMPDSSKAMYQQIITSIESQIEGLNVDTIKSSITKNYKIGTFIFNEDKTMYIKAQGDSIAGTWSISNDTLKLVIQQKSIPLYIKHIDSKKMELDQNTDLQKLNFDIIYTFEKR